MPVCGPLPTNDAQNSSHFRFDADDSECDKGEHLSTLILVLAEINVDKDYCKLGQGL